MSNQSGPSGRYGPYYLLGYPAQFWTEEDQATGDSEHQRNARASAGRAAQPRVAFSDAPNVRVVESRLENVKQILEVAADQLGDRRKLGIFMMAVVYVVADDQQLRHVAQRLYGWTAPGSILALAAVRPRSEPGFQRLSKRVRGTRHADQASQCRRAA